MGITRPEGRGSLRTATSSGSGFTLEQRRVIYHTSWRAEQVVDRVAQPNATVATDSGYDGWTYPLFGARLSRRVEVVPDGDGPYVPGPEVEWVAIDHAFPIIWGNGRFSEHVAGFTLPRPGAADREGPQGLSELVGNREFERVYFVPQFFQAVFHRIRLLSALVAPGPKR